MITSSLNLYFRLGATLQRRIILGSAARMREPKWINQAVRPERGMHEIIDSRTM